MPSLLYICEMTFARENIGNIWGPGTHTRDLKALYILLKIPKNVPETLYLIKTLEF